MGFIPSACKRYSHPSFKMLHEQACALRIHLTGTFASVIFSSGGVELCSRTKCLRSDMINIKANEHFNWRPAKNRNPLPPTLLDQSFILLSKVSHFILPLIDEKYNLSFTFSITE